MIPDLTLILHLRHFMPLTFVTLPQLRETFTNPIQGTPNISLGNCNSLDKCVPWMNVNKDASTPSKITSLSFYVISLCYISCSSKVGQRETGPFWPLLLKFMAGFVYGSICLLRVLHFLGQQKMRCGLCSHLLLVIYSLCTYQRGQY